MYTSVKHIFKVNSCYRYRHIFQHNLGPGCCTSFVNHIFLQGIYNVPCVSGMACLVCRGDYFRKWHLRNLLLHRAYQTSLINVENIKQSKQLISSCLSEACAVLYHQPIKMSSAVSCVLPIGIFLL